MVYMGHIRVIKSALHRREFIKSALAGAAAASLTRVPVLIAADSDSTTVRIDPDNIIKAPSDPSEWPVFRKALEKWRQAKRQQLDYNGSLYLRPDFAWVPSCYCCCFIMMCDQSFYNPRLGQYTVESFLDEGIEQFGGFDSVVLWHAYPRIGVDDRNQFDFYRDMPGGLPGLRELVGTFHKRNVRVFIDYNPWDTGTRREQVSDIDALVSLIEATDADGIFLDTMSKGVNEFRTKLDATRPGVVLEGEGALPLENVHDHHMSWAQWFEDSLVPGLLRNKWFERRHMQHQIKRWDYDHTSELHTAWMNGSGMMVWENVFCSWVGWSERDRSILRAMLPIQRRYTALFAGDNWSPLVPAEQPDVYASLWEGDELRLWTLVNRSVKVVEGPLLRVPTLAEHQYFNLVDGHQASSRTEAGCVVLAGLIPPRGMGCFLSCTGKYLGDDFRTFLTQQAWTNSRASSDAIYPARETRWLAPRSTTRRDRVPNGMIEIPTVTVELKIQMRERECGFYESSPPPHHSFASSYQIRHSPFRRPATLSRFAIDLTPVANAQFAEFVDTTNYRPKHPENFLRHWTGGKPPAGKGDHPVVYVDLDDARAYAKWAGKRLPTEEEWQYAAQGPDGLKYPWGNEMQPGHCNCGETGDTTPVKAFSQGRSPFGCYDMCGNTWEWTESQRSDGRSRFCIIRGGSYFAAKGSNWYVDGGPQPTDYATKFLLMWPGLDRCGTIGFRCVVDLIA